MKDFTIVPNSLSKNRKKDLLPFEILVMLSLYTYSRNKKYCWPKIETLSEELFISERKLRAILHSLEKKGYIQAEKRWVRGRQTSNKYTILDWESTIYPTPSEFLQKHLKESEFRTLYNTAVKYKKLYPETSPQEVLEQAFKITLGDPRNKRRGIRDKIAYTISIIKNRFDLPKTAEEIVIENENEF